MAVYNDTFPQVIVYRWESWLKGRVNNIYSQYPGKESCHLGTVVFEINNGSGIFFFHRVRSLLQMVPPLRLPHLGHPKEKVMGSLFSFVLIH